MNFFCSKIQSDTFVLFDVKNLEVTFDRQYDKEEKKNFRQKVKKRGKMTS